MRSSLLLFALLGAGACAPATPSPAPAPERVLVVDSDGSVLRRSTADENFRMTYPVPPSRAWAAVVSAYATLGIQPTISDRASGQHGNAGFVVPRRIAGRPIGEFFSCGQGMTGPRIDSGRVYGNVMSVISDDGKGGSVIVTHVGASLRPNDGAASDLIPCASTGALENLLRKNVQQNLGIP